MLHVSQLSFINPFKKLNFYHWTLRSNLRYLKGLSRLNWVTHLLSLADAATNLGVVVDSAMYLTNYVGLHMT